MGRILEQSPCGWHSGQEGWGKKNTHTHTKGTLFVSLVHTCLGIHYHYCLSNLIANILSLWAQRAAGSFPVCWWKRCLGFLPTWSSSQTVWLVHGTATARSWSNHSGHQNIRWKRVLFCALQIYLKYKKMHSHWDIAQLCSVSSGIWECSSECNTHTVFTSICDRGILMTFFICLTLVFSCLIKKRNLNE